MKRVCKKVFCTLAVIAGVMLTLTCNNVGLGESVDTQPPSLKLTYPESNVIIRDSFIIAGTCSDETSVASVTVTVKNTGTGTTFLTENAEISSDNKSWQITINNAEPADDEKTDEQKSKTYYAGWELPDGKYTATIVATDRAGKKSDESSLSFTIDNTPPVFVISNPGVVKGSSNSSKASAYGSIFTIEGSISEENSVTSMDVTIYDEDGKILSCEEYDGEKLESFHETDVGTNGSTNITIAQSGSSNTELDNRYSALYGSDSTGTVNYTCKIVLTDNAQVYKTPDTTTDSRSAVEQKSDSTGNQTAKLYLNDDIYSALLSQKLETSAKLKVDDLKNILNGTSTLDSATIESALSILNSSVKNTGETDESGETSYTSKLYFSLNPEANPTYNITGYTYDFTDSENLAKASSGQTVSVSVASGLDGTLIDLDGTSDKDYTDTVKVWMREYDETPDESALSATIESLVSLVEAEEDKQFEEETKDNFIEYSSATTEAPVTTFEDFKLIYDYGQHDTDTDESSVSSKTFGITLPENSISLNKFYIFVVTGSDADSVPFSQNTIYGFIGDEKGVAPTLKITSPANSALKASSNFAFAGSATLESGSLFANYLGAVLTVTDQTSDTTVGTCTRTITRSAKTAEWSTTDAFTCDTDGNWTFDITKLSEYESIKAEEKSSKNYLYTLELTGKSSSGHEDSKSSMVQVDSILPVVEISSITPSVEGSEFDSSENTYVNGTVTVKGTVEESNLESVYMQIFVDSNAVSYWTDDDGNSTDTLSLGKVYSFSQSIDTTKLTDTKSLDVRVTATDKVGNQTTYSSLSATDAGYTKLVILQETDKPVITLNNASIDGFTDNADNISAENGNLFGTVSNNKISVSVKDDDLVKTVEMNVYKDGVLVDSTSKNNIGKSTYSNSFALPTDEGVYQVEIIATDDVLSTELSGRTAVTSNTGKFYVAVSAGAPAISIDTYGKYQSAKPPLTGTVGSSATSVTAEFIDVSTEKTLDAQPAKVSVSINDGTVWSSAFDTELSDSDYKILFTAADNYGQTSSTAATFTVDGGKPTLKITQFGSNLFSDGLTESQSFCTNSSTVNTIKGTASDEVSKVAGVFYYVGTIPSGKETPSIANGWYSANLGSADSAETTWTLNISDLSALDENSSCTVHIKATDNADNSSDDNNYVSLVIDSTAPTTTLTGTSLFGSDGNSVSALTSGGTYYAKESFTLSGTITEEHLDSIKINGTDVNSYVSENIWTYEPSVTADGTYTYKIVLTDKAENQSEYTLNVTYDTTAPSIAVTSPTADSNTTTGTLSIEGNVSDSGSGVKQIGYVITEVTDSSDSADPITGSKTISESGNWTIEDVAVTKEGKYTLKVSAQDVLGNEQSSNAITFYYDNTAPTVSALISDDSMFTYGDYNVYGSTSFNIKAAVSDAVSGIAGVVANSTTTLVKGDDGTYTGKVIANLNSDGTTSISVVASDKFGNSATYTIENIMVDLTPPTVAILSYPETPAKDIFTLSGTVTDNLGVKSVVVADSLDASKSYTATVNTEGAWSVELKPSESTDGVHTYTVTATDVVRNTSTATCRVTTDTTAPTVVINGITPTVTKENVEYVNGKITVTGIASDTTSLAEESLLIKILDADGTEQTAENVVVSGDYSLRGIYKSWNFVLDTTKLTDSSLYIVQVSAEDSAGNVSSVAEKTINVNQSTDAPVLTLSNADSSVTTFDAINDGSTNIFGTSSNNVLKGTITDDDGVKTVKITCTPENGETSTTELLTGGTSTSYSMNYTLPSAEGGYLIKISVEDTNGETSVSSLDTSFVVAIDSGSPSIKIESSDGSYYNGVETPVTVSGIVSDGSGKITLSAVYSDDGTNSSSGNYSSEKELSLSGGSASISDTINISSLLTNTSDGYTATYTAKDRWGQTSSATFKYYKDAVAPVFDDENSSVGGISTTQTVLSSWFKDETLSVTVAFTESGSGVETVYFWLDPSSSADSAVVSGDITKTSASATASNSSGMATVKTSISGFSESSTAHTLEVVAIDNAGNKSAKQSYSISIDSTAPDFASSYYTFDGATFADASGSVLSNKKKDITIYGTVSDDASGVGEFNSISVAGTKITTATVSFSTDELPSSASDCAEKIQELTFSSYDEISEKTAIKSWKIVIPAASINSGSVALSPTDTAGNGKGNPQKIFTFEVDTTAPKVSFTSPSVSDSVALSSVNGTSSITGKITEAKTPKSLEFYYSSTKSDNLSDYTKLGDSITDASAIYTWSKEFDFNTLSSAEDAEVSGNYTGKASLYVLVAATDMAENANYEDGSITSSDGFVEIPVDLNGDVPTVRITNLTAKSDGSYWLVNGEDATIEGTLSDDDGDIAEFKIFEESIAADSDGNITTQEATGAVLTWATGSSDFTYQPSTTTDGEKKLYFYVKDAAGGIFYTGKNTQKKFTEPKVQVRSGTAVASDEAFAYTSDETAPKVSSIKIAYSSSESGTYSDFNSFTAATVVGGSESRYAKFQIEASDDIGIESGTLTLSVDNVSAAKTLTFADGTATSDVYDLSAVLDGEMGYVNVSVVVKDQSGQSGNASSVFTLDNKGPATFSVTSPVLGTISTSDVTVSGIAQDGSGSGILSVEFAVPTASQNSSAIFGDEDENGLSTVSNYSDVSFAGDLKDGATAGLWSFVFSSDANGGQLTQYTDAYEKDNSSYALSKSGYIYTIPLWFKLTDNLGNVSVYQYKISYNPNANWPTATVTTPKTGTILGTSADFAGTATDNNNVTAVYIQFDLDGDGDYDADDKEFFVAKNSSETVYTASDLNFSSSGAILSSDSDWWGVKLSGTTSWNGSFTLPQTESDEKSWQVRACAVDDENIAGLWSDGSATSSGGSSGTVKFRVDDDAPKIGLTTLYISNDDGSRSYSSDMYVSKSVSENWYLNISLEDTDSGINIDKTVVTAKPSSGSTKTVEDWTSEKEGNAITYEGGTYYNYKVKVPLDLSTEGTVTYTVRTVDNSKAALSTSATYSFTIDNTAPTVNAVQFRGESLDMRKLYNTNYEAEISSVVQDDISGMASLNFFFERGGKYYVPFAGGSAGSWKMEEVTGSELTLTDGIPGITVSGSGSAKSDTFEISDSSADTSFIRAGGIIKIDGSYYNIKSVSDSTVTFDGTLAQDVTAAVFPYALSVNYTTTTTESSSWSNGAYSVGNDDGDGLVETVAKSGSKWTCTASLLSDAIADGTIVLHAVAIDAAGNVSSDVTTRTMIANHTPRLAKVHLATDLNGDGSYTSDEIEGFSALDESEKTQEVVTLATDIYDVNSKIPLNTNGETDAKAYFKVTGDLVVVPEFVGGQEGEGTVYYDAVAGSQSEPTWDSSSNIHGSLASSNSKVDGITAGSGNVLKYLTLSSSDMKGFNKEDHTGTIALSLWDSSEVYGFEGNETSRYKTASSKVTDGTASSLDSTDSSGTLYSKFGYQWTIANIPVYFDITDDVAPTGTITPFYWNGEIESAVSDAYNTSENNSIVYYGSTRIGHIDIKDTPDVSGTIKIEGDVSDDQIMQSVAVSVGSITTTATYTASSAAWSNGTVSDSDSTTATLATNGYALSISDNSLTQNGHSAKWTLLLDTSKLTNGENAISVTTTQNKTASAGSKLASTPGTTATTSGALTGYYPVTVVPYITKVARTNSEIAAGHSDYGNINRSKLGHYPVAEGETLTVYGWNFGTSAIWSVGTGSKNNNVTPTAGDNNLYSFEMTVPSQSGALKVTSGDVDSVNNSNSDNNPAISGNALVNGLSGENGYNAETYAMRGNSTKYWANDDRYLSVWALGNYFNETNNGAELQNPVMTADASGNLYASWAAQSNSNIMFSYGVNASVTPIFRNYDQPATYTGIGFDRKGDSGGASVAFIPEHQGYGGTYSMSGLSSSQIVGGMGAIQVTEADISDSAVYNGLKVQVTGNPGYRMDGSNYTAYYNLANYDMTHRLGSFAKPKSVRYGNYLHNIWYDTVTESIRYSVVDTSSTKYGTTTKGQRVDGKAGGLVGWVVLDGGYTGQDRVHNWTANEKAKSNNSLSAGEQNAVWIGGETRTNTAAYSNVLFIAPDSTQRYASSNERLSATTEKSITTTGLQSDYVPKIGDTIALMQLEAGNYKTSLRKLTGVPGTVNGTYTWAGAVTHSIHGATIYGGDLNVVGVNSITESDSTHEGSSGSSSDIDVDSNGHPVVAYFDDSSSKLRIAKASVEEPNLASEWNRIVTSYSCSGSVSMRIDSNNNIHIMFKNEDGQLCYLFGAISGTTYNFNAPEIVDETGSLDYGNVSIIETGTKEHKISIPCMTYMNSAGTAQSVKYAVRKTAPTYDSSISSQNSLSDTWDYMIVPSMGTGHYAVSENQISIEGRKIDWKNNTTNTLNNGGTAATPATVDSVIAFKSKQFETAYLKSEK